MIIIVNSFFVIKMPQNNQDMKMKIHKIYAYRLIEFSNKLNELHVILIIMLSSKETPLGS